MLMFQEILTEFLWPYSWAWCRMGSDGDCLPSGSDVVEGEPPAPLCRSPGSAAAASDLVLSLVHGCVPNMGALVTLIEKMFYSGEF